jgi:hypothetical protein
MSGAADLPGMARPFRRAMTFWSVNATCSGVCGSVITSSAPASKA